jgi:hypothetical protein
MTRPIAITVTTALMAIAVVLHLVAATASPYPIRWSEAHGLPLFVASALGGAFAGTLILLFEAFVLWAYWDGRKWSRWFVILGCLLCFVSLRHFLGGPVVSQGRTLIIFYRLAVAVGVMGYMATSQARAWFNEPFPN